jgi:hypothetical protein
MDTIASQFTFARSYCIQRMQASVSDQTWQHWVATATLQMILNDVEQFIATDFQSRDELDAFLTVAVEMTADHLLHSNYFDYAYLIRRHNISREAIQRLILETCGACGHFFTHDHATPAPALPHRRVLTKHELQAIWARFTEAKQHFRRFTWYELPERSTRAIVDAVQQSGAEQLLQLYPAAHFGYELDCAWFPDMFQFDDTYWTTSAYTWYICGAGHGYPEIAGDMAALLHT